MRADVCCSASESPAEKSRLLLFPPLRSPAWLQLPFAFRNPSPLRGHTFPNVAGLEPANEKHRQAACPGHQVRKLRSGQRGWKIIASAPKMADAHLVFIEGREMLEVPGSGVLSFTCLSQDPPPKSGSDHKPRTGLQTDRQMQGCRTGPAALQQRLIALGGMGALGLVMLTGRMRPKARWSQWEGSC